MRKYIKTILMKHLIAICVLSFGFFIAPMTHGESAPPKISTTIDFLDYVYEYGPAITTAQGYFSLERWETVIRELRANGIERINFRVNALGFTLYPTTEGTQYGFENGGYSWDNLHDSEMLDNTLHGLRDENGNFILDGNSNPVFEGYDPVAETIRLGHKYGMEVWCWENLWDDAAMSISMDPDEYPSLVAQYGIYPFMDPFFRNHHDYYWEIDPRILDYIDDMNTAVAGKTIGKIEFISAPTSRACTITASDIDIYTSNDNETFSIYTGSFTVANSRSDSVNTLTITGLSITDKYVKLAGAEPWEDYYTDDNNEYTMKLDQHRDKCKVYDTSNNEMHSVWTIQTPGWYDPVPSVTTYPLNFGKELPLIWDINDRKVGFMVGEPAEEQYFLGVTDFTNSTARTHKLNKFKELIKYDFDGFMLSLRTHSKSISNGECYGYNQSIADAFYAQYGQDILDPDDFDVDDPTDRQNWQNLKADALDDFLDDIKDAIIADDDGDSSTTPDPNGVTFTGGLRKDRPLYMSGLKNRDANDPERTEYELFGDMPWHYSTWFSDGSVDGIIMLGSYFPEYFTSTITGGKDIKIGMFTQLRYFIDSPINIDDPLDIEDYMEEYCTDAPLPDIRTITITSSSSTQACRISASDIEIYISNDNIFYTEYTGTFSVSTSRVGDINTMTITINSSSPSLDTRYVKLLNTKGWSGAPWTMVVYEGSCVTEDGSSNTVSTDWTWENMVDVQTDPLDFTKTFSAIWDFYDPRSIGFRTTVRAKEIDELELYETMLLSNHPEWYQYIPDFTTTLAVDMDDNSELIDASIYKNDGTVYGATLTTGISGTANTALSFDGSNDYVDFGNPSSLKLTGSRTMSAWIKLNMGTSTDYAMIVGRGLWQSGLFVTNGALRGYISATDTNATSYTASNLLADGIWYHVAMTFDLQGDKKIHLYINGTEATATKGAMVGTPTAVSSYKFTIGSDYGTDHYFNGVIDQVKVYNRVLSAEEIREIADSAFCATLDEGSGTAVADSSIFAIDGTLNGTVDGNTWTTGVYGNALCFNGSNNYIDFGYPAHLDFTGSRSFSAWIKPAANGSYEIIAAKNMWRSGFFTSNGKLRGYIGGETTNASSLSNEILTVDEWHYVSMNFDIQGDKKICLYINGEEVSYGQQIALEGDLKDTSAYKFYIGSTGTSYWFNGAIDEVKAFGRLLSKAEMLDEFGTVFSADFDEGTGSTVADDTMQENDGTVNGASWTTGISSSNALSFDGTDDYVDFGIVPSLNLTGARTIAAWIKPAVNGSYNIIACKNMWRSGFFTSNGKLRGYIGGTTTDASSLSNETLTVDTWYHVAMTFDPDGDKKVHLYINGEEVTYSQQITLVGDLKDTSAYNFYIGSTGTSNWFNGVIDNVRIYDWALGEGQIDMIYQMDN